MQVVRMQHIPDDARDAWTPELLSERFRYQHPSWYIVGGWALDLWHGYQTRDHEDLEFCILSDDVDIFRDELSELDFFEVRNGNFAYLAPETRPRPETTQLWGADMANLCWRVDMMIEHGTRENWTYKRDPSFRLPRSTAVRETPTGIPYLAPALALLFKAKHVRAKDEEDLHAALPKLHDQEKADLRCWLEAMYPGHEWITRL
ncbi:amino acid transporter [Rhizobium sp. Root73]|nr:amino acid transporter [Rhizobium sp. Root1204]KQY04957.1 amino acid transporter [Rhizobium sp. Root1334]KRC01602.1 amino acid transporter [Rhizobium sp. Root73]